MRTRQHQHIAVTLLLLILSLTTTRGQEAYEFGCLSEGDIEWYKFEPAEDARGQWACFTLTKPADVWLTLMKRDVSGSALQLYDGEDNGIAVREMESSTNETRGYANLPAGNYQVFVDFPVAEYMELGIEVKAADLELYEENLGSFNASFSESYEMNLEDTYRFFHGRYYDGCGGCRLELGKDMDVDVNLDGSTVTSSRLLILDSNKNTVAETENKEGLSSLRMTNLRKGTYHVLFWSDDDAGSLVMNIAGHAEEGIDDTDASGSSHTNHITERTYTNAEGSSWNDKTTYYDSMGREQQTAQKACSPDGRHDLAGLTEYDEFGRIGRKWLTGVVEAGDGAYTSPESLKDEIKSSHQGDSKPYAMTEYEPSPLNRVASEHGAGSDWQDKGKAKRTRYLLNDPASSELDCMRYSASGGMGTMQLKCEGSYPKGSLTVNAVTDEDGRKSYEFKDGWGNLVLNRREVDGVLADTYYIYDAWGHPLAILPPMASNEMCLTGRSWNESDDIVSSYAYLHAYDEQYRQIGVKLPGCDWKYTIYDRADTPVLTQDGEQRKRGEWAFVISDVWGRPCLEGICKNALKAGTELPNTSASYTGSSSNYGYSVSGIMLASPTYHQVTFYDSHGFLSNTTLGMSALSYDKSQGPEFDTKVDGSAKGRETGSIVAIDGDMGNALRSANYYDYRGRTIQTVSTNQLGGTDKTFMAYDFTDHVVKQRQAHAASGKGSYVTDMSYTFDHTGRPLTTTMAINGGTPTVISSLEYDNLGRLIADARNGNKKLRTGYAYNIRQWTKSITGSLFSEQLFYNESHNGSVPLYGGDISAMDWSTGDASGKTRGYVFGYDGLNRLKSASYLENGDKSGNYSTTYSYDLMDNMQAMVKNGLLDERSYGRIDDLTYEYNGNQVVQITDKVNGPYYKDAMHFVDGTDAEIEYEYDKNGCMTKDLNKKICKIEYNLLNLPTKLSFEDGSTISYSYDADGTKLGADYNLSLMNVVKGTSSSNAQSGSRVTSHRDYCGNFIYEDGALKMVLFDGGYVTFDGNNNAQTPVYHFYLQDHLGNNRVVADANGNIEQVNHYYPFGGLMAESTGDVQPYKYNGKELDRMHGLDSYDYGARWMADGRFTTVDPHAIDHADVSPYSYCENNPAKLVDKDGKDPGDFFRTMDAAAIDFALNYNGNSILNNVEYATSIVTVFNKEGKAGYTYFLPSEGQEGNSKAILEVKGHKVAAIAHTHGKLIENSDNYFSGEVYNRENGKVLQRPEKDLKNVTDPKGKPTDIGGANRLKKIVYVATPNGKLRKYIPQTGKIVNVTNSIPSDMKDPHRVNYIFPERKNISPRKSIFNTYKLLNYQKRR